jgi:hypothetical protein
MTKPCTCYVSKLDEETRFGLRYGAHNQRCPSYAESLDPVDYAEDEEYRALHELWKVHVSNALAVLDANSMLVCMARTSVEARLIATAPKLLKALEDLMFAEGGEPGPTGEQKTTWLQALEAVAEATRVTFE